MSRLFSSFKNDNISRLPNEILYNLLDQLDDKDQQYLSLTCRWLYRLIRMNRFGAVSPAWEDAEISGSEGLPASSYRDGVFINGILYIPILAKESPYCWSLEFVRSPLVLIRNPIKFEHDTKDHYEPCKFAATAAIGNVIYIFGGQNLCTERLTNTLYELNVNTFELRQIQKSHMIPKPRMLHTLNSIDHYRLALFGGKLEMNGHFYNAKELAVYDTRKNEWTRCDETKCTPFSRSNHSTMFTNGKLYVYGGQKTRSRSNRTHDDPDIWVYDVLRLEWQKFLNYENERFMSTIELPENWIPTSGASPSRRCGAAILPIRNHLAILGGNEICESKNENRSWEFIKILSPKKRTWAHIRIKGMPLIDCVAFMIDRKIGTKNIFVLGKNKNEEKLIMGWIKDTMNNN
ncbi:19477_t:CDS:2 [Funneliformis geosporum]|uniref:1911_t:CDS:1 n=1 Tax=Funneliformis geosporum TaxID=1117311 RepID=A0A9W4SN87_9GLOM|nr:1911_t:CDS:2 [Funneliformis geosporum]CAI2180393.1 19477_t:CDS:2 [Funneliformis geosporum]